MSPLRQSVPCVRIFVSSTFNDFRLERDELQRTVFPRLRALCQRYGARFQAVDLRWGIAEEAALDQRTVEICLEELQRCQEVSPVPNFLLLLGDRYGWRPLPARIENTEFMAVVRSLEEEKVPRHHLALLERWYRLDENDVPASFRLRPRGRKQRNQRTWEGIERGLRQLLERGAASASIPADAKEKYFLSATAQEVMRGVFHPPETVPDVREHVFGFSRVFTDLPPQGRPDELAEFCDVDEKGLDAQAVERLQEMRARIGEKLGPHFRTFDLPWSVRKTRTRFLRQLSKEVFAAFSSVIEPDLQRLHTVSQEEAEIQRHLDFQQTRVDGFHGRAEEAGKIAEYVAGDETLPLLMTGEGGTGKSSLVALVAQELTDRGHHVVARFVGITGASSRYASLISSIGAGVPPSAQLVTPPKTADPQAWQGWFRRIIVAGGSRVVLLVDALDQLNPEDQGRFLEWIPARLPDGVKMVLSSTPGGFVKTFQKRFGTRSITLGALPAADATLTLEGSLAAARRTLQPAQRDALLRSFEKDGRPLYLRLALQEAVQLRSDQKLTLPATLPGIVTRLLRRMERADQHGEVLPKAALSYLSASRNGLVEEELLDLLSLDLEVMQDFRRRSPASGEIDRLPFSVWSRLHGDFGAYLSEHSADHALLYTFYHRIIAEEIERRYLSAPGARTRVHGGLASYFEGMPNWIGSRRYRRPNLRKLSEAPFHLAAMGDFRRLFALVDCNDYRDAKFHAGRKYEWLEDIHACFRLADGVTERDAVLERLIRHLVDLGGIVNPSLTLEEIHGFFVYRKSKDFHEALIASGATSLTSGTEAAVAREVQLGFLARKANALRRSGALDEAKTILEEVVHALGRGKELSSERSRAEYDLGYIHYLRGEYLPAVSWLSHSATSALEGGAHVSHWISRIVSGHVQLIEALGEAGFASAARKFSRLLDRGERHFKARAATDTTAERWVMNVRAHRFEVAFLTGNATAAREQYLALETDPWIRRFGGDDIVGKARGRLALLEGRGEEALTELGRYVPSPRTLDCDQAARRREALAWDLYDLGRAEKVLGRAARAKVTWERALELPADAGNLPWHKLIRLELQGSEPL